MLTAPSQTIKPGPFLQASVSPSGSYFNPAVLTWYTYFSLLNMKIMIREQNALYFHQKWYQNSDFGSVLSYQIKPTCLTSTSSSPAVWRLPAEPLALLGTGSGLSLLICSCTGLIKSICAENCSIFILSKRSVPRIAYNHHSELTNRFICEQVFSWVTERLKINFFQLLEFFY